MILWFFFFFGLQGLLMAVDEFYFHYRREVPVWERWGHPIDSSIYLLAFVLIFLRGTDVLTIAISVLSCLVIVKDEWVHARLCKGGEQILHALLFMLHPVILYFAHQTRGEWGLEILGLLVVYLLYQIYYWNFYEKRSVTN